MNDTPPHPHSDDPHAECKEEEKCPFCGSRQRKHRWHKLPIFYCGTFEVELDETGGQQYETSTECDKTCFGREVIRLGAENAALRAEICGCLSIIPPTSQVIVREGGGPEDDEKSLAVSVGKLVDENRRLQSFETAYREWSEKTEWVQGADWASPYLGKHLADAMRLEIERLQERAESEESE